MLIAETVPTRWWGLPPAVVRIKARRRELDDMETFNRIVRRSMPKPVRPPDWAQEMLDE